MAKWKPSVVYLRGPGFLASLRTVRIRLRPLPAGPTEVRADRNQVDVAWDYAVFPGWGSPGATADATPDSQFDAYTSADLALHVYAVHRPERASRLRAPPRSGPPRVMARQARWRIERRPGMMRSCGFRSCSHCQR
jgi:hypothetical protein